MSRFSGTVETLGNKAGHARPCGTLFLTIVKRQQQMVGTQWRENWVKTQIITANLCLQPQTSLKISCHCFQEARKLLSCLLLLPSQSLGLCFGGFAFTVAPGADPFVLYCSRLPPIASISYPYKTPPPTTCPRRIPV